MDLGLNEFQKKTKETAREFLEDQCPKDVLRRLEEGETGHSPDTWRQMADLGWMALGLPEESGGLGGNLIDTAVIVEEMGYAAYMSPFLPTVVSGALPLLRAGTQEQRERLLPGIADGSLIVTAAIAEESGKWAPSGVRMACDRRGDRYVLNGEKRFVDYAGIANWMVVFARTPDTHDSEGITGLLVRPEALGITMEALKTTAGDRQHLVRFTDVEVPAADMVGEEGGAVAVLTEVLETATALQCAYMVGGAQRALDMTVAHAQTRTQFGQPLGKFQAVQHHCADMAMLTEGARLVTYEALWLLSERLPARKTVAMAKAFTNEASRETMWLAHQIHGGIGIMKEYDLHFYFRQAKSLELRLGVTRDFFEVVAEELELPA